MRFRCCISIMLAFATVWCMPSTAQAASFDQCAASIARVIPAPTDERVVRVGAANCNSGDVNLGGTGWMTTTGMIATASHVVDNKHYPQRWVRTRSGVQMAHRVFLDAEQDLALLEIESQRGMPDPLPYAHALRVGEITYGLGHPLGSRQTVAQPLIAARGIKTDSQGFLHEYVDQVRQGFSGGPVLNLDGEVIGLISNVVDGKGTRSIPAGSVRLFADYVKRPSGMDTISRKDYAPGWKTHRSRVTRIFGRQCGDDMPLTQ